MLDMNKEVIHTILVIYAALCLGFTVLLTGGQCMMVATSNNTFYRGQDATLICYFRVNIKFSNCQWYFTQKGGEERPLTNGTRYTWSCRQISTSPAWVLIRISFKNVTFNDSGIYTCEVMTASGADRKDTLLTVLDLPEVIVQKTQFIITAGEDIVLNCIVNGNGVPIQYVIWYRRYPSSLIPLTNGMKYEWRELGLDASIKIKKANENDTGIYVCEGTTEVGSLKGSDIELRVGYKPTVTVNEYNYSIGMGDNLTLHCSIDGHGTMVKKVAWSKETNSQFKYLDPTTRVFWDISSPSIKINIVLLDDAGRYTCIGVTDFGTTKSSQISVQIFSKPSIIIPDNEYKTINGTNAVLEVRIDDRMKTLLSVQWEKYEEENQQWCPLENNSRLIWTYAEPSLKIATALVEDDGKYRIIGKTAYHEVRSSPITLTIYVPSKIKELETRPVFIRQGDKVQIRCLVDGRPEPKVTWRFANGTTIVASSLKNVQENILILESVTNLNEGNYTCIAENSFSRDESLISLTVSDFPVFNQQDEDLSGSPLKKYVVPGASVFVCVALIVLIVVVILITRKQPNGRTDKPNLRRRSKNGQKHPSPSEKSRSGNNHAKFSVHISEDMTYPQEIRMSSKHIDGNKSIRDTNIPQSDTHIDGNKSIIDTDASHVYMNINNTYVQQRSSTSNSNIYINVEKESDNTQVNKTKEVNYEELDFSSNAQDENIYLGIRGSPSDTTCTDVVVFTL